MKKIILTLVSLFSVLTFSLSANAIKVGALYLDTQGFFGEIKVGIETAGEAAGIDLLELIQKVMLLKNLNLLMS